jgi:hypothetical protein
MTIEVPPIETEGLGFGMMSAGTAPAGLGTPATVAVSPAVSAGSRYINPVTRDYQIAYDTGQQAQMPPARQRVLLALTTLKGSSTAAPLFGLEAPRKMGNRFVASMQGAVRAALAHLTLADSPVIKIQRIDVRVPQGGRAITTVSYVDLSTGANDSASN